MEKNLPGIVTTITRGLGSFDRGDVFSTRTFRTKTTQMRIDAQKELYLEFIRCKQAIELAKLQLEKDIRLKEEENEQRNQELKYSVFIEIMGQYMSDKKGEMTTEELRDIAEIISIL